MGFMKAVHCSIAIVAIPRLLLMSFPVEERCLSGLNLTAIFVVTVMTQGQVFELRTSLHMPSQVCQATVHVNRLLA